LHSVPGYSVAVPAGGSGTLNVRAIALTPGAALPSGPLTLSQQPLAADALRTAVYYGIDWGYADSSPGQVALAIWQLQDGVWRADDHTIAERISTAAASLQGTPAWLADGRSVLQAAAEGQATLSELTLTALPESPSVGAGTLTVNNTGFGDAVFHLPYGAVFSGPSGSVIAWAAPALPGSQATPTAQPAEPTATAEPSATATPQPTVSTDPPSVKGDPATPAAEPTATATARPKDPTSTPEPPTATPTAEPEATDTPDATDTPTPESTPETARLPENQQDSSLPPERQQPAAPQPSEKVAAPAPETAELAAPSAPLPPSANTTPPPVAEGRAPVPVSTSAAASAPLPQPVGTQPGAVVPNPVQTVVGTPPGQVVPPPVASVQPTRAVRQTPAASPSPQAPPSPSPTVFEKADPTATTSTEEKPVEQPTPAPTPVPVPPTPVPPSEGPVINVAPGDNAAGGTGQPSPGESGTSGTPQTYNPNTGGGASQVPLWLGLLSALMVLGGWRLRRVSRPAHAPVRSDEGKE
jgi:hypothetical protein